MIKSSSKPLALQSGIRWHEQEETSAGFLKRSTSIRAARTPIPPLIHPTTQSLCTSKEAILDAAATYYGALYTPDPIDMPAVHNLLDALPDLARLSSTAAQPMIKHAASLINPFQMGFVRDRFIADNGLLMKLIMEHTSNIASSSFVLLLDQEKAYNRVHPAYFRAVLLRFGFPWLWSTASPTCFLTIIWLSMSMGFYRHASRNYESLNKVIL